MERFVFVTAIILAVIFGLYAMASRGIGDNFHFSIDGDGGVAAIAETTAARLEPTPFSGAELELKHLAAFVTVIPEDRADYLIEIDNPGGVPMPTVSEDGGRVVLDGRLRGRIASCADDGGARLRGYDDVTAEQLTRITIRAPRTLDIDRGGAGRTEIGATEALDLDFAGCGAAVVGDVAGAFNLEAAGAGNVQVGSVRRLEADVAGAGDVTVAAVAEAADIDQAGAGTFTINTLTGSLDLSAAGAGDLIVSGGAVTVADLDLAGAGNVRIAGPVERLKVSIVGVADVDVEGVVGDLDAEIAGPGAVTVQSVTGSVRRQIAGPGAVNIGDR